MSTSQNRPHRHTLTMLLLIGAIAANQSHGATLTPIYNGGGINGSQSDALYPAGMLFRGNDGNFYGTDPIYGTIFYVAPTGQLSIIYAEGNYTIAPQSGVIQGSDGNFYGTMKPSFLEGPTYYGNVFSITPSGNLTILHSFNGPDGDSPNGNLIEDANGNIFGTTFSGGPGFVDANNSGYGTIFEITKAGVFSSIAYFSKENGSGPVGGLVYNIDGNYYGTTSGGGANGNGTVYKMTSSGQLTTLFSFNSVNGNPEANLTKGANGILYGTTLGSSFTGSDQLSWGTVFSITPSGVYHNLVTFNQSNGAIPWSPLTFGTDGNLYGMTYSGGTYGLGTIFEIAQNGDLATLISFDGTNGYNPYLGNGLIQTSSGTFYGSTFGGGVESGTIFRLDLSNSPIITTQPTPQYSQLGPSLSFSVIAIGQQPLTYQWQFNGQNIPGATDATYALNSPSAANSGGYSVLVSNSYGSIRSVVASLAVMADGANGNVPMPINATPIPTKPPTVKNLILITHGWQSKELNPSGAPTSQSWMIQMVDDIQQQLAANGQSGDWQVVPYYWLSEAWTKLPETASSNGENIGAQIGKQIATQGYERVHLISHSAGAGLIQAITEQLRSAVIPPIIQTTFLDPYEGFDNQGVYSFGTKADWSDEYFTPLDETSFADPIDSDSTGIQLPNCFAVDISWLNALATVNHGPVLLPISSHSWAYEFYTETVTGMASPCAADYGFKRSFEGGGWDDRRSYPIDNYPVAIPCGQSSSTQNIIPISVGLPFNLSVTPTGLSAIGAALVGAGGFALTTLQSFSPFTKSGGVHPLGGTENANTPAWLAIAVTVTNPINFVQFSACFTDTNTAQGLLTAYWNTNQIGAVDERAAGANLQAYRFVLPGSVKNGIYTLSFRLDSFDNSSSISITNVATGFAGISDPTSLSIFLTNGFPLVQLTAATNFTYLIQSSTNLVDWVPIVMLFNTNGTTGFVDTNLPSSSSRFYQAVLPF